MYDSVGVWNSTLVKHYVLFGGVEPEGSHEVRDLVHWDGGRHLSHTLRLHPLAANTASVTTSQYVQKFHTCVHDNIVHTCTA